MDDAIRAMTLQRLPSTKIRQAAIARGMVPCARTPPSKIMQGITTFEEAQKRVLALLAEARASGARSAPAAGAACC